MWSKTREIVYSFLVNVTKEQLKEIIKLKMLQLRMIITINLNWMEYGCKKL